MRRRERRGHDEGYVLFGPDGYRIRGDAGTPVGVGVRLDRQTVERSLQRRGVRAGRSLLVVALGAATCATVLYNVDAVPFGFTQWVMWMSASWALCVPAWLCMHAEPTEPRPLRKTRL